MFYLPLFQHNSVFSLSFSFDKLSSQLTNMFAANGPRSMAVEGDKQREVTV
jgi:hypothetical protein